MSYKRTTTRKRKTGFTKNLRLDNNLDSHHKPVKIGEDITGLQLADKDVKIEGDLLLAGNIKNDDNDNLNIDGDVIVGGDLTVTGNTLTFGNGKIIQNETSNTIELTTPILLIDGEEVGVGSDAILTLSSYTGSDPKIIFKAGGDNKWAIGHDETDDHFKFDFETGFIGADTKMTLTGDGDLTVVGDLQVNGDDIKCDGAMNLEAEGGAITLDASNGNFLAKKDGTEFSVANSAYAGMILGYRMIGEDAAAATYALTTSMAVPLSDMTVRFKAPPSGAVEVMVQVYLDQLSTRRNITFGLSDNATYNSIGNSYEHKVMSTDDRENDTVVQNHWTITGLTAGDTYNYWFGAKTSGVIATLGWGGTSASEYPDFIMKVTALPTAVSDFAVYG